MYKYSLGQIINNLSSCETNPWYEVVQVTIPGIESASDEELVKLEAEYLKQHENDMFYVSWPQHVQKKKFNSDATFHPIPQDTQSKHGNWWAWQADKNVMSYYKNIEKSEAAHKYAQENYGEDNHFETILVSIYIAPANSIDEAQQMLLPVHPKEPACTRKKHSYTITNFEEFSNDPGDGVLTETCRICGVEKISKLFRDGENNHLILSYK
jgi:hypothetical protein